MKKAGSYIFLSLSLAGAYLAGTLYHRTDAHASSTVVRKAQYYIDPMHPSYKSDKPGIAPDCGMQLEPVYADGGAAESGANGSVPEPAGALQINAAKQQRIGVQVSRVEKSAATHTIRLFGRVAPDELRIFKMIAGVDGFVRESSAVTTGSQVEKNQWLATFSSPETRPPVQGYLVTLDAVDRQAATKATPTQVEANALNIRIALDRLQAMGMSALQAEEVRRTRAVPTDIRILAPVAGFVMARNVSPGQRFEKGAEWYRVADLSRIWVLADVFERDAQFIRPGQRARVARPGSGREYNATVSQVLPQFDANARVLKVRLEVDNPENALRPDMFVDAKLDIDLAPAITVPTGAVIDSGEHATVFVDRGNGYFEPREVTVGWRYGDSVQITSGLTPGEQIVTAGNFLLDSETRLTQVAAAHGARATQVAANTAGSPGRDIVCGMELGSEKSEYSSEHDSKRYVFCSGKCKQKFDQQPEAYMNKMVRAGAGSQRRP